jgi:hypothetical protein
MLGPVEMRREGHAILIDVREPGLALGDDIVVLQTVDVHCEHLLEADAEGHHLEPAAVSKGRSRPVHEATEAAGSIDDIRPRLQVEVVGVCEHGLGSECRHALGKHRLDGCLCSDSDKSRAPDRAVRRGDYSGAAEAAWQRRDGHKAERCADRLGALHKRIFGQLGEVRAH